MLLHSPEGVENWGQKGCLRENAPPCPSADPGEGVQCLWDQLGTRASPYTPTSSNKTPTIIHSGVSKSYPQKVDPWWTPKFPHEIHIIETKFSRAINNIFNKLNTDQYY